MLSGIKTDFVNWGIQLKFNFKIYAKYYGTEKHLLLIDENMIPYMDILDVKQYITEKQYLLGI